MTNKFRCINCKEETDESTQHYPGICPVCNKGGMVYIEDKALRYNEGKPQWSLVDFDSLEPMVRVLEYGMKKYTVGDVSGRDNWKNKMEKKKILESLMRHLVRLMADEELDSESKLPHIGHVMANCMFYSYHSQHDKGH